MLTFGAVMGAAILGMTVAQAAADQPFEATGVVAMGLTLAATSLVLVRLSTAVRGRLGAAIRPARPDPELAVTGSG